jgi:hypothetical protein
MSCRYNNFAGAAATTTSQELPLQQLRRSCRYNNFAGAAATTSSQELLLIHLQQKLCWERKTYLPNMKLVLKILKLNRG